MKFKLLVFLVFGFLGTYAQNMVQIGIQGAINQVRIVNLKQKGIILLDKSNSGLLKIKKIDNELNIVWEVETDVSNRVSFLDEYYDGKFLYLLLEQKNALDYQLLKISTSFAAVQKFQIKMVNGFTLSHFVASEAGICLGGVVKNEPFLVFIESENNTPKYYSSNLKGETLIQSVDLNDYGLVISFLNKHKKSTQVIFRTYSFSGKILNTITKSAEEPYTFLSAKYFNAKNKQLLVGNYGIGKANSDGSQSSQGIYVADLEHLNDIKYYSFDKFKNFFGFLNERQRDKLQKQVKRKKDKGSEYNFNYRLHINELIPSGDNLLISSEVFMPEFRNNSLNSSLYGSPFFYPSTIWGRQYINNYWMNNPSMWGYRNRNSSTFDGFKYIEGVVISINSDGELIWDNSVQYKNLKYYNLRPHIKVSQAGSNTFLSYTNADKLNLKEFTSTGEIVQNESFEKNSPEIFQKSRKSEFENFEHWYDGYFFNWGIIKNADSNFKQTCFIQKIAQ